MLRRIAFSLLAVVLVLGAVEVGLRLADYPPGSQNTGFTHREVYWVEDPSLHNEAVPHKETGGSFLVSTDANGLRAPIHPEQKPAGTFRILTLGCSTTFGWGVNDDESYPAQLERVLREQGHTVEVINGGQPGHTSFQGLWLWDRALARYEPDLVVFGYIVQDARKVAYSDRSQALMQGNADFLKQNLLYRLHGYRAVLDVVQGWRVQKKEEAQSVYRVPPEEYADNIRAFLSRASGVGARLMLFGFPLEREGYTTEHRGLLHSAADVLGVPIFDPQKDIEAATATQQLYFPQDRGHANAAGCSLIGRMMAEWLVANHIVP